MSNIEQTENQSIEYRGESFPRQRDAGAEECHFPAPATPDCIKMFEVPKRCTNRELEQALAAIAYASAEVLTDVDVRNFYEVCEEIQRRAI